MEVCSKRKQTRGGKDDGLRQLYWHFTFLNETETENDGNHFYPESCEESDCSWRIIKCDALYPSLQLAVRAQNNQEADFTQLTKLFVFQMPALVNLILSICQL